jgi:histidine ammonia-lyase
MIATGSRLEHRPVVVLPASGRLTIQQVYDVAAEGAQLQVDPANYQRVRASRAVVDRALHDGRKFYGLNTHVGHLRDEEIPAADLIDYQYQILAMHARGIGDPLSDEDVRALMVARIVGMSHGGSGAHPDIFGGLIEMLNAGVHPVVPQGGSVGASDLMQMAAVGLVLAGGGEARFRGEVWPGGEAMALAGVTPRQLRPKDGLALVSANGLSIGLGALAVVAIEKAGLLADAVGALSLEAISANLEPFDAEVAAAKPFPGQLDAAARIRDCLDGSELVGRMRPSASVQDPLSFRVMPQVHGALREHVAFARRAVEIELQSVSDNPMVSLERDILLSNGNFQPLVLALSFETVRLALAHVAILSERRINRLRYEGLDTQPPTGRRRRFPFRPYHGPSVHAAAASLAEIKHLATPVTLSSSILHADAEDHATMAPLAVMLTRSLLQRVESMLAIEALMAVDVLGDRDSEPGLGRGTRDVYERVRAAAAAVGNDASAAAMCEAVRSRLLGTAVKA